MLYIFKQENGKFGTSNLWGGSYKIFTVSMATQHRFTPIYDINHQSESPGQGTFIFYGYMPLCFPNNSTELE